jgi:hypothetical protein
MRNLYRYVAGCTNTTDGFEVSMQTNYLGGAVQVVNPVVTHSA